MKRNSKAIVAALFLCAVLPIGIGADARREEPKTVPAELKGTEPHNPKVAHYYLDELVKEGKMTKAEAEKTEVYMIFRHARRMQDLKEVEDYDREARRAYMKHKRELRGNPLEEYAAYCGFTMERAKELINAMHDSDKGTRQYNAYKNKK